MRTVLTKTKFTSHWKPLFLLAWFLVRVATAQNLGANPGFETGNTTGWVPFGSPTILATTTQVHSGTYACLVTNRTGTYMGVSQSFFGVMQSGQTYNVSIWLRLTDGTNQTMQVTAQKIDGSGTSYTSIASGSISSSGWTQLVGTYTPIVSGTLTNIIIYFEVPTSANAAYFADDFSVSVAGSVAPGTSGQCLVDWGTTFQRIDGFGASSAWRGSWTTTLADLFFSTNVSGASVSFDGRTNFNYAGCGLSFLRSHIAYASSTSSNAIPGTSETSIMQFAQARGARVWSTPWTPPAGFKSTNDIYDGLIATGGGINGGSYLGNGNNLTNLNYASQLANYVLGMKNSYGVNLYAISVQNEPDAAVNNYEACQWTGQQFHDFVTNLSLALTAKGVGSTKIILPESQNWATDTALFNPTINDSNALAAVAIVANHNYVANNNTGDMATPAQLSTAGLSVWETEVAQFSSYDGSITNALYWAGRIHLYLTAAQANAWHYWWLIPGNNDNEGLTDTNGVPAKRLYALGQFARFVRPNFFRINVANNTSSAQISAFKDTLSPAFAMVAINGSSTVVTQVFNLTNVINVSTVTPWMTTAGTNIAMLPAVTVSNASFTYSLPAMSITTFAGRAGSNTAPFFSSVGSLAINPGMMLVLTNSATDTDSPPQRLTYNLLSGPVGAALNSSNGIFAWRPLISQADSTNLIQIKASDDGSPALSATNAFSVTVHPASRPLLNGMVIPNQVSLSATGMIGPDYSLFVSTNLMIWQLLLTTNPGSMPVIFTDTNVNSISRFYRIKLGP